MKNAFISSMIVIISLFQANAQSQFANNSFELWSGDSLVRWKTSNQTSIINVVPVNDSHSGSKAVQLIVAMKNGNPYSATIMQTTSYNGAKPLGIRGWYKMNAVNGDQLGIMIAAQNGLTHQPYGDNDTSLKESVVYKQFYIPFNILNSNVVPDQVSIVFGTIGIGSGGQPNPGTDIILDDIEIVTQTTGILLVQNSLPEISVFPNPCNTLTNLEYDIPYSSPVEIELLSITGISIKKILNIYQNAGHYCLAIPLNEFQSGVYLIKLKCRKDYTYKRIIIN